MCARPGKILSSPKMIRIIHSASTLSVESRRRYRYRLKIAMRNSVADMVEILRQSVIRNRGSKVRGVSQVGA